VEDASVTNNIVNPASEEANEVNLANEAVVHEVHTTEAPKEDNVSEVMLYSLVLCFLQTKY
jgi:Lon-like ATP-dependent protease